MNGVVSMASMTLLTDDSYRLAAEELMHVLKQSGGTKEAVRLIELTSRIGTDFLLTFYQVINTQQSPPITSIISIISITSIAINHINHIKYITPLFRVTEGRS